MKTLFFKKSFIALATLSLATSVDVHAMNEDKQRCFEIKLNPAVEGSLRIPQFFENMLEAYAVYGIKEEYSHTNGISDTILCEKVNGVISNTTFCEQVKVFLDDIQDQLQVPRTADSELNELNRYCSLMHPWASASANAILDNYSLREQIAPENDNDFAIANELLTIAREHEFIIDTTDVITFCNTKPMCLRLEKSMAPKTYALLENVAQFYNATAPILTLTSGLNFDATGSIGINIAKHLTNDEIEVMLAHELQHVTDQKVGSGCRYLLLDPFTRKHAEMQSDLKDWLSRSTERDADTTALRITKKVIAFITAMLKSSKTLNPILNTLGLPMCVKHQTYHERICFALSQL